MIEQIKERLLDAQRTIFMLRKDLDLSSFREEHASIYRAYYVAVGKFDECCYLLFDHLDNDFLFNHAMKLEAIDRDKKFNGRYKKGESFDVIKEESGIYIIIGENDEVLYVGQSKNLRERLRHHFNGTTHTKEYSHEFKRAIFNYVFVDYLSREENLAILKYKPKYNILGNGLDGVIKAKRIVEVAHSTEL